jgi:hypothetical protein
MDAIAQRLKPWRMGPGFTGAAIAAVALIVLEYFDASLTPRARALVLGLFLLSGWLLTPFILYTLVLENRDKYYFLLTVYPRFLRIFVAYGWVVALAALTVVWTVLVAS